MWDPGYRRKSYVIGREVGRNNISTDVCQRSEVNLPFSYVIPVSWIGLAAFGILKFSNINVTSYFLEPIMLNLMHFRSSSKKVYLYIIWIDKRLSFFLFLFFFYKNYLHHIFLLIILSNYIFFYNVCIRFLKIHSMLYRMILLFL